MPRSGKSKEKPSAAGGKLYCDVLAGSIARKGKWYVPGIYIYICTYYSRTSTKVYVSMLFEEMFSMGLNVRRSLLVLVLVFISTPE